jgi:hypothetical protein
MVRMRVFLDFLAVQETLVNDASGGCQFLYGIELSKVYKNPHPKGWGYTNKACPELRRRASGRGLKLKIDFY